MLVPALAWKPFIFIYVLLFSRGVGYGWAVCVLALAASLEELAIHLRWEDYSPDRKCILQKKEARTAIQHRTKCE